MAKERDEKFDATQPTLIVKSGNTARKFRRLEKEVVVLGRAAGCDVGLEAPEVAAIHCVIVHAADGWRVHDCTGRGATRLNGQSVQDEALSNEDVLQVGSFSFEVHLPPPPRRRAAAGPDETSLQRVQRSRYNLAQLALRLRDRLRKAALCTTQRAESRLTDRQEELDRQAEEMQALQRDLDARFDELKQTAQKIAVENTALEKNRRRSEMELVERQAQAEAALRVSMEEYQERRRQLEESDARALAGQKPERLESAGDGPRSVEIRARELGCFADHLRRFQQRLHQHEEILTVRWEECQREQQQASDANDRERDQIAREEGVLREQRSEVVRLMGEMRHLRQNLRTPSGLSIEALREETEQLRRALAERDQAVSDARQEAAGRAAEADEFRARLEAVESDRSRAGAGPDVAALSRFRVELETSRRSMDEQIRLVEGRFAELGRTAEDAEAQIGRERVRIAQERQELERIRGELWPEGPPGGAETLIDTPSPLRGLAEITQNPEPEATVGEAPRAPSRISALDD